MKQMEQTTIKINWEDMTYDQIYKDGIIKSLKSNLERAEKTECILLGTDINIDRISTGVPASERSKISRIREVIADLESTLGKTIPNDEIFRIAKERGISEEEVEDAIEKLKRTEDLFEPKSGFISRMMM